MEIHANPNMIGFQSNPMSRPNYIEPTMHKVVYCVVTEADPDITGGSHPLTVCNHVR